MDSEGQMNRRTLCGAAKIERYRRVDADDIMAGIDHKDWT
jgi:hypothetical protein